MITIFMVLIMKKKMTPLTALVLIPVLIATLAGFGGELGPMMQEGVKNIGLTGVMLIFAILYFSLMIDTGLFEPLVNLILKAVKNNPVKTAVGTALLTAMVSLDGDGSSTYLIVVAAFKTRNESFGINLYCNANGLYYEYFTVGRTNCSRNEFIRSISLSNFCTHDSNYDCRFNLGFLCSLHFR